MHERFKSKILIMEVGDSKQAMRVAQMAKEKQAGSGTRSQLQLWRDWPDGHPEIVEEDFRIGLQFQVKGSGNVRAVVLFLEEAGIQLNPE